MTKVVVVGSYNQDHVWSSDALPQPGATRLGTYAGGPGGKGFNQAIASMRAGAATVFITGLGNDAAAAQARALAAADHVDLRAEVFADLPSGTAGIFVDSAGRNVIVVAPGANEALTPEFVAAQADAFVGARVVLAQLEVTPSAVRWALELGRATGALTLLNPAPANAPTTDELIAAADLLTPNETEFVALMQRHAGVVLEADTLAGLDDDTLHAHCRQLAPAATLVITLGAGGVFVSHPENARRGDPDAHYRVPSVRVTVVDTTGAGDAFSGALAAALATEPAGRFRDAIVFATRYAGRSTERHGAAVAMPTLSELAASL